MPVMTMLVGLPGSGKSTRAEQIKENYKSFNAEIFSSDELRKEINGDINSQENTQKIFQILHKRIRDHLMNGCDAIYDATNINKKQRIEFLKYIAKVPNLITVCDVMATPYEECLKRNSQRDRFVPEGVIEKMYKSWSPPHYNEGFDVINIIYTVNVDYYTIDNYLNEADNFDQHNQHHSKTLGLHCRDAAAYLVKKKVDDLLYLQDSVLDDTIFYAAVLHDNGKMFVQSKYNRKGEEDGDYHYFNHEQVGSYDAMFYLLNEFREFNLTNMTERIIEICNIIYYHMRPYISWAQSEKAKEKDRKILGEELFNNIMLIHEADLAAH